MSIVQRIIELVSEFLRLLRVTRTQEVEEKRAEQAQAVQKATQQEQVIANVQVAQEVRDRVQRDLADNPDSLWDTDEFERK